MSSAPANALEALEPIRHADREMTLTVRTVDSVAGVESLRSDWELLQGRDLPADIDYYLTIAEHHREILRPNVLVVGRGDEVVAIVAAYLQRGWIVHRLGPWNPYTPTITALTTAYRGFLGDQSPEVLACSLGEFQRSLAHGEADAIHLRYVVPGDVIEQAAHRLGRGLRRERLVPVRTHWSMELGASLNETLAAFSSTTRESLRRTSRKLERAYAGRLRLEEYRDPADGDRMFADIDMIASRSYQRHGDTVFGPRELERALVRVGLEKGWYRALVLYLDETPAAFWTGYAYGGVFGWRGATGYDPMFREHSPGTFVLLRLIASLAEDPAITTLDLGGGDVDYKRRFADTQWEEVDIRLFGPGVRNLGVNLVGSSLQLMHHGLRSTAQLFGAHDTPTKLHRKALKQRSVDNTRHRKEP